ncbi:MAG: alkaline phosphatase D family protein [Erythrobacter sp.]|nr:alkaline phosphatase D family protein [Erythrobacter sp.]
MSEIEDSRIPNQPAAALTRRGLFSLAGTSAALATAPAIARSFGSGFTHSVASGEPAHDRVLLWTRYVADEETTLDWQVSDSDDFTRLVSQGRVQASPDRDWCAKAIADGLAADSWYFFRFVAPDGTISPVGRTRTLPQGRTETFKLAVFSCSNFGFGWFNAYAHAVEADDCDLAVHLGDYIYEYGRDTYPGPDETHPGRTTLAPGIEIVTLADYRLRYATYRADPDLQRLHQVLPMIAIWDDHESTNNSWKDGAQNHQSETEGDWRTRKSISKQVFREWMPVSDAPYTAYEVGDLATLFRLDTRLEGRDEQLDLDGVLEGKETSQAAMEALLAFKHGAWSDPERHLLGDAQEQWLVQGLSASKASGKAWQVLVQQVLMGDLRMPSSIVDSLGDEVPTGTRRRYVVRGMANQVGMPFNMDAWDGYPAARARLFEGAQQAEANLLVLTGDTHNCWAFELDHEGAKIGVEFGVPGVTSPGYERSLPTIPPADLAAAKVSANDQLKWADTSQRGYITVELSHAQAITEYRFVETIRQRSTNLAGTKRISSATGSHALEI